MSGWRAEVARVDTTINVPHDNRPDTALVNYGEPNATVPGIRRTQRCPLLLVLLSMLYSTKRLQT